MKPSNILVERRGDRKVVLRVTDFGIGGLAAQPVLERSRSSSSLEGNMASVLTGSYSPLYASPQQMRGDKPDPRDDVYALGVIWYQLLAGDLTTPAPTGRRWILYVTTIADRPPMPDDPERLRAGGTRGRLTRAIAVPRYRVHHHPNRPDQAQADPGGLIPDGLAG